MYTTAKINPLTGETSDSNPSKKARQEKRQARREERDLNKSLNEGIKKQGKGLKQYYQGTPVEETVSAPKAKDWRDKVKQDRGGKKGSIVQGGGGGRPNYKKMDTSCKKPK